MAATKLQVPSEREYRTLLLALILLALCKRQHSKLRREADSSLCVANQARFLLLPTAACANRYQR
eukprot:4719137-Pleurochrysis_carterae.AAC.4